MHTWTGLAIVVLIATAPLDWRLNWPVVALAALYPLVTMADAWTLLGERISRTNMAGVAGAIGAAILLSSGSSEEVA